MKFSFKFPASNKAFVALRRAPAVMQRHITGAVIESGMLLERESREQAPMGSSDLLKNSIAISPPDITPTSVAVTVGSPLIYAEAVELGTKPHMPPVEALIPWVKEKFGPRDPKMVQAIAWGVARKIARDGTKPSGFFAKALQNVKHQFPRIINRAAQRALEEVGK